MIGVDSFSKAFKKLPAVQNLSFSVEPGEVLGLLGPNGAGKSTTLRAIAGLVRPDSGVVSVNGLDVQKFPLEVKKLIAYLPDEPVFFDHLSCWEHLEFLAQVHQIRDHQQRSLDLLKRLGLEDKKDSFAANLSKGLRQRLGIACALLHSPKAILFDEPMIGLDPIGLKTLNELIREEAAQGTAVILSSHLLPILEEVCTKVLVMQKGRSLLYGTLDEIRKKKSELSKDASLEQIFFYATQSE